MGKRMTATCVNCGSTVMAMADNSCPQCRRPVGQAVAQSPLPDWSMPATFTGTSPQGKIRLVMDSAGLHVFKKTLFGWKIRQESAANDVVNVNEYMRTVSFQIQKSATRSSNISFVAASASEAAQIVQLLPKTQTPEFAVQYAAERAKQAGYAAAMEKAASTAIVTPIIVALNIAVYIAMGATGAGWFEVDARGALAWGADYSPLTTTGDWWRLLTSAFVHFGLLHLALNMWVLILVGRFTERLYGKRFFVLIYLFGAIGSGLASTWWDHGITSAGASGAIFAVYGALLAYLLFHASTFPQSVLKPLMKSTVAFIGYNIFYGLTKAGISNAAHLGGLASGFLMGMVVCRPLDPERRQQQTWPRWIAGVVFGIAVIALGVVVIPKDYDGAFNYATIYDFGKEIPADYPKAMKYYLRAARGGNSSAMNNIGVLYLNGQGVPKDPPQAMSWFQRAAERGDADGIRNVGVVKGEQAFEDFLAAMTPREEKANNRLNEIIDLSRSGKITDPDFTKVLDAEIIPEYQVLESAAQKVALVDGSPSRESRDTRVRLYQLRFDALSAFSKYLHTSDEAALRTYHDLWSQSNDLIKKMSATTQGSGQTP